ncbi:MAG TPA: flagellar hook capping FlgD N-terminal domain-containing protein [Phycisphaerae bacterium]|nr:flagellar hook capping FlgD N-terminal domain-containing protein [Phycisphaerae bacterium]
MAAISGIETYSSELKLDYMKLLVTQLQNQDPLEPMDNAEMTSQLALISQLEQLEGINATFTEALAAAQGRYAAGLIGKDVTFISADETVAAHGRVDGVEVIDGAFYLQIGDQLVALDAIRGIGE